MSSKNMSTGLGSFSSGYEAKCEPRVWGCLRSKMHWMQQWN